MKKTFSILLVVILVMAMVPAVALADGETVNISTVAQLETAIANQASGQTWNIASGVYDINRTTITAGGQAGWYFPVIADGITIKGAGSGTVITSSVYSANGSWASQDMISVFGDNVTIQDLTVKPKMDTNKAFEIIGKNVTLKNIKILHNDILTHASYCAQKGVAQDSDKDYWEGYSGYFAGSVYFNPQNTNKDIGTATLDNVLITQAWISCSTNSVKAGILNLTNGTTIDFRNSWYASEPGYGVISTNPNVIHAADFTVIYDDTANAQDQIISCVPSGAKLMQENNSSTEVVAGVNPTFTITIPAKVDFGTLVPNTSVSIPFKVSASGVLIDKNGQIIVGVADSPLVMKDQTGTVSLPFALANSTAPVLAGGAYTAFTGNRDETGSVSVDTHGLAYAGSYKGTMDFVISYQ